MSEFWLCFNCCIAEQPQPVILSEDPVFDSGCYLFRGMDSVSSIQNQMQSKGGYGGGMSANVQMQLVDTKAG
ncbi:CDC42 small effector protein 2 [Falco rusticolus]|uniref:CDC42 small effector protein 2 n=1 Tax=Falco rusticolus TaxID=120794 RepID=UPI001886570D|nr:CDC42 small effector protein 2 [Falco rusticolus]